ncbi:MAG TPA: hypothetical protein VF338_02640 [Leptolinea sp.]
MGKYFISVCFIRGIGLTDSRAKQSGMMWFYNPEYRRLLFHTDWIGKSAGDANGNHAVLLA